MIVNSLQLAWQFYLEQYRARHQVLMRWVQGILLLFIVTLSQTSNSIQQYLQANLNNLLGADAVLSQKQGLSDEQHLALSQLSDEIVITQQVTTTLTNDGKWQQVQLKAVDQHYPLQGELKTSNSLQDISEVTVQGPKPGHIWLDARAIASLSIELGQTINIANTQFIVSRVLQHEPDRLMEGHSVAMRAMMNASSFAALNFATDLIQYRYLLAANKGQINQIIDWQKTTLPAAQILHKQGRHPLALFWQRTENFIGLASIILFFMAAIAVSQLAQVQIKKELYFSAICMSVGASKSVGLVVSFFKWFIGVILLLPIVLPLSALAHYLIIQFLHDTFAGLTWSLQVMPLLLTVATVILLFAVFYAPVWVALLKSSVAAQFNNRIPSVSHWVGKVSSCIVLCSIAFIYSDNMLLTLMMLVAVSVTIVLMIVMSWSGLTLGEKLTQNVSGLLPFAMFMMKQRLVAKSTQIMGVGLCAFLLLFTLMLLRDLGATMSSYQRQHDGNVFISQASQSQMQYVESWAKQQDVSIRQIKPYMQAKLVEINQVSLADFSDKPSDSLATLGRSIRLHWSQDVPSNNEVVTGSWWQEGDTNWQQVSIEQEVMTDLGFKLGDSLRFIINQQAYDFNIVASHDIKPGAGSITFWVQMPPAAINFIEANQYNMASLELNESQWALLGPLWQKFPTLRMVSLKELTDMFDRTLLMITQVISGFSAMIFVLAIVVMLASINTIEVPERRKNSVIMSFGFTRKTCLKLNVIEWLVTSLITAAGALMGVYIAGQLIYKSQFSLNYEPSLVWMLSALMMVVSVITAIGVFASRRHLRSSIRTLLAAH